MFAIEHRAGGNMGVSVQNRGRNFQLRVTHKLLPKTFFHTFEHEADARSYGEQLMSLLNRGVVPIELLAPPASQEDKLLTRLVADYVRSAPGVSAADKELANFVPNDAPLHGVRLSGLAYTWVERYVAWLKSPDKNLTPSSIQKRIGLLRRALNWHIRSHASPDDKLPTNVFDLLPRGYGTYRSGEEHRRVDAVRDRRLSPEECIRIDAALAGIKREDRERPLQIDPAFQLLYQLIVDTGLRLFEAYRLHINAIDLEKHIIRVSGSKGHHGKIKPRVVPIKHHLREPLARWCNGRPGNELFFPFWDGDMDRRRQVTNSLSRRFATLFDYAKVIDFTEHDLRHEAACRWFELRRPDGNWTFSDIEISRIMGWSNLGQALRYASLRGEDLAAKL